MMKIVTIAAAALVTAQLPASATTPLSNQRLAAIWGGSGNGNGNGNVGNLNGNGNSGNNNGNHNVGNENGNGNSTDFNGNNGASNGAGNGNGATPGADLVVTAGGPGASRGAPPQPNFVLPGVIPSGSFGGVFATSAGPGLENMHIVPVMPNIPGAPGVMLPQQAIVVPAR